MVNQEVKLLALLARADGRVDDRERKLIYSIGAAHKVSQEEIDYLLTSDQGIEDFEELSKDEKFEYLYHLIKLMKVDGRVFDEEIQFCMDAARRLGYELRAVLELYPHIHANIEIPMEKRKIRKLADNYLRN